MIIVIVGIIIFSLSSKKTDKETYSNVKIGDYQFAINDKYKYEFDDKKDYGILKNKDFLTSYIYLVDMSYSDLIRKSSYYTNSNSKELDSSIEEVKFGEYDGFVNVKKVNYRDVDKDYNLVIILIKVTDEKTFVFQYEKEIKDDNETVLDDIKDGLSKIEKVK